jgi:3-phenylpropionate/trans-cinnamate dioxygenase ferredoxin subunit
MRRFDYDATPLVVCRSEDTGEVFAMEARCPHQGALLCRGTLTGIRVGTGTTEAYTRRGEIIRCPAHDWDFDVRTGESMGLWPPLRARTCAVRVEDDRIYVGRP